VQELYDALRLVRVDDPSVRGLLIGRIEVESGDALDRAVRQALVDDEGIVLTDWQSDVASYYHAMDVVVLPSYREGFPQVPLEAAAASLPVVATRTTGCVDAVVDGVTGMLVTPGSPQELALAIRSLRDNPELARALSDCGRARVVADFAPSEIWQELLKLYCKK
jgi:glycosyltransferase involved in cell wall biosynthesis